MSPWMLLALAIILVGAFAILTRLHLLAIAVSFWFVFAAGIAVIAASGHEMTARWHLGPITGFEGQVSYYHVDFKNRLLAISPTTVITSIISGAAILQNVGSVKTDGVDIAGTLHFGPHFSL